MIIRRSNFDFFNSELNSYGPDSYKNWFCAGHSWWTTSNVFSSDQKMILSAVVNSTKKDHFQYYLLKTISLNMPWENVGASSLKREFSTIKSFVVRIPDCWACRCTFILSACPMTSITRAFITIPYCSSKFINDLLKFKNIRWQKTPKIWM